MKDFGTIAHGIWYCNKCLHLSKIIDKHVNILVVDEVAKTVSVLRSSYELAHLHIFTRKLLTPP